MNVADAETDENLLGRLAKGDRQAFTTLVRRHADRFYGLAWRTLYRKEDAEDVVQDAFMKLWQKPDAYRPDKGTRFTTWFYRVVVNLCLDRNRGKRPSAGDDLLATLPAQTPLADQSVIQQQQDQMIERAILTLPERQRVALNLCFYEGLSNQEAATIMKISVKALESLLMRAKDKLQTVAQAEGWRAQNEEVSHAKAAS